ncbi:hypothetical protein K2Z84_17595 [Candidatus Binatia bacterium]|jgi:hypothetical protein|nr:hypothetical protein [Candidatus Binatia bacterium]
MTLRDLLLVLGAVPLLGVVALRLAAEMGFASDAPPPEALTTTLGLFGFVFVVYVALTLRSIATATRAILAREPESETRDEAGHRKAAVSDFAIHLDRSTEIDLRGDADPDEDPATPAEATTSGAQAPRRELFGEVNDLLTRIPSARTR